MEGETVEGVAFGADVGEGGCGRNGRIGAQPVQDSRPGHHVILHQLNTTVEILADGLAPFVESSLSGFGGASHSRVVVPHAASVVLAGIFVEQVALGPIEDVPLNACRRVVLERVSPRRLPGTAVNPAIALYKLKN